VSPLRRGPAWALAAALVLLPFDARAVVGVLIDSWGHPLITDTQVLECGSDHQGEGKYLRSYPGGGKDTQGWCAGGLAVDAWKGWHQNGELEWKGSLVSGRFEGKFTSWYENGTKRATGYYADGFSTDEWKYWHENGEVAAVGSWVGGKESGCWEAWHDNGERAWAGPYVDGEKVGRWLYWTATGEKSREDFGGEPSDGGCWWILW